jgi:hypothetical protein
MTDLMQPDAVSDEDEVVMRRPAGAAKRHAPRRSAMIVARLSSNSVHRTVAGATHQSLIDGKSDAIQSSRAIGDVVGAVQKKRG